MSAASVSSMLSNYQRTFAHLRQQPPLVIGSAIGVVTIPLLIHVARSYRGWLELGPGGPPYNFFGYLFQAIAQPFARRDTTDSRPLADPKVAPFYEPHGKTSYLSDIPARNGDRPVVPSYVAPQRQMSERSQASRVERMQAHLAQLAKEQPARITLKNSGLEAADQMAIWVQDSMERPAYLAKSTKGEIAHVHPEGSSHMVLSLADAETAISKGWAEKHMLSGVLGILPHSYVIIYAPRSDEEFAVWKQLVAASINFNTASF